MTLDILVDGKKDNFVKLAKDQASPTTFSAVVKITGLNSKNLGARQSLKLGTDTLDFNTSTGIFSQRPVNAFGAGMEIVGAGNTCTKNAISGILPFSESTSFASCGFPGGRGGGEKNSGDIAVNQEYIFNFQLSPAQIASLGLDKPCARGGATTGCIAIAPYLGLNTAFSPDTNLTITNLGKDVFVKVYNTTAEKNADSSRPSDVPAYGGTGGTVKTGNTGSALLGFINQLIGTLLGLIQEFIYTVFYYLIAPVIQAMLSIRTYTDVFAAVIYPGWEVIRNLCNILFIVALIAIGLGTLFRIESYQYRHLLVQLVIAALLVNFSLVIAQAILGVADTIQSQFLPDNVEVIRSLARDLMLNYQTVWSDTPFADSGYFSTTVQQLFTVSLAIGSFFVFAAVAAFLIIRVVMLWVLLMLSPFAYAMRVLPATASYSGKWWDEFLKYAFFTPIMAFFLNMAAVISSGYLGNPVFQKVVDDPSLLGNSELASFVFRVGSNIIILVFLVLAIRVANQAGVYGASALMNVAQKGMFAPFKLAGGAVQASASAGKRYGYQKLQEKSLSLARAPVNTGSWAKDAKGWLKRGAFAVVNASEVKHAYEDRKKRRASVIEHTAAGGAANIIADFPLTREPSTDSQSEALEHATMERIKELPFVGERQTLERLSSFMKTGKKDINAIRDVWSQVMSLAQNKGMNTILLSGEQLGLGRNFEASDVGVVQFLNAMQEKGYGDKEYISHMAAQLSNTFYKNGEYGFAEMLTTHDGHPAIIETDSKGEITGKRLFEILNEDDIIEEKTYDRALELFNEGKAATISKAREMASSGKEREKILTEVIELKHDKLKAAKIEVHGVDDHFKHEYGNYESFVRARKEAQNNKNKMENQDAARNVHWSSRIELSSDGGLELSYGGAADIYDRGAGYFEQYSRQQPKVVATLKQALEGSPEAATAAFEKVKNIAKADIIEKERSLGIKVDYKAAEELAEKVANTKIKAFKRYAIDGVKYERGKEQDDLVAEFEELDAAVKAYASKVPGSHLQEAINREKESNPTKPESENERNAVIKAFQFSVKEKKKT